MDQSKLVFWKSWTLNPRCAVSGSRVCRSGSDTTTSLLSVANPPLFIGVVSHVASAYRVSQGPAGLAAQLRVAVPGAVTHVNMDNFLDQEVLLNPRLRVTPRVVQDSLNAQLDVERQWARYLGVTHTPRWRRSRILRWARRTMQRISPPATASVERLLNIEMSHIDIMRKGWESGAPWILILEDDAACDQISDLAAGLTGLMASLPPHSFVNLSRSFPLEALGISHLVRPSSQIWNGSITRRILYSDRPTTNTVCAILYSRECLAELMKVLAEIPALPVIPIDWKVNAALMRAGMGLPEARVTSWFVEPPPIAQSSMHDPGILST